MGRGVPDLDSSVTICPFLDLFGFPDLFADFPSLSFPLQRLRGTVSKSFASQSGPFPKVGNPLVWNPPRLASPKLSDFFCWPSPSSRERTQ